MNTTFRLNLVFSGVDLDDDDVFEDLAQFDHINWRAQGKLTYASVVIDSATVCEAVERVRTEVANVAPSAQLLSLEDDLVSIPDVASRIGVTREAVRNWASGRRQGGFPRPLGIVGDGIKVWAWRDVNAWLMANLRVGDAEKLPTSLEVAEINHWLRQRSTSTTPSRVRCGDDRTTSLPL